MDTLSDFVNDIVSFELGIPLWLKISFIIVLILLFITGGYIFKDSFDISYLRNGYMWFIVIGVINLLTILLIYIYYSRKQETIIGPPGNRGNRGQRGKTGTSVSCGYCKNNIYIQKVRKSDIICNIDARTPDMIAIYDNIQYFIDQTEERIEINYSSFINKIILENTRADDNNDVINKFRQLLNPQYILVALYDVINKQITRVSSKQYGTFRSPVNKVGYLPLGDSVYGGTETFELNSFIVSGNIMYPARYDKLISFTSYNNTTNDVDTYSIWRPVFQTTADIAFDGTQEQRQFLPLGDVCRFGTDSPSINDIALIKDTCLDPVKSTDLKLAFIYLGETNFTTETTSGTISSNIDYKREESYLIENRTLATIEIFSVWRTPMNTFITNSNIDNEFINDTIYMNLLSNLPDAINEYGNIKTEYKNYIRVLLTGLQIPQIIIAMIYTKHFFIENTKEIIYYINRYQAKIPKFRGINIGEKSLGELMKKIAEIQEEYDKWNEELIRNASIDSRSDKGIKYDALREKHLPPQLIQIYNNVKDNLDTIPIKIENSTSLLDVINNIIPNGLDGRIAIDSEGIAEGGIMMNSIQEAILRLCKVLMPPGKVAYTIKDECLGTFAMDRDRESAISQLTDLRNQYFKYIDVITGDYDKYKSQIPAIKQYENIAQFKMGELCGHIPDYFEKIKKMDLDEFTTSRILGIIQIYQEINLSLDNIITNTMN